VGAAALGRGHRLVASALHRYHRQPSLQRVGQTQGKEWFAHAPVDVQESLWSWRGKANGRLIRFLKEEGVAAALTADSRGSGALLFAEEVGPLWEEGSPTPPPVVVLAPEQYARIGRLIAHEIPVKVELDVRVVLGSGEEQEIFGSRGYIRKHYGDAVTMELLPEHETFSGYFNLDNGSGKVRGVYLQDNDMMRPIFSEWLAPFADQGVGTISIRNTFGTDHLSFDAVGLPGFQFIQDPLDYETRTHHSDIDVYDHAVPADLMQASAVMASVLYNAANREEKLPCKPLPKPLAQRRPSRKPSASPGGRESCASPNA
jgi:hypothetical protein